RFRTDDDGQAEHVDQRHARIMRGGALQNLGDAPDQYRRFGRDLIVLVDHDHWMSQRLARAVFGWAGDTSRSSGARASASRRAALASASASMTRKCRPLVA